MSQLSNTEASKAVCAHIGGASANTLNSRNGQPAKHEEPIDHTSAPIVTEVNHWQFWNVASKRYLTASGTTTVRKAERLKAALPNTLTDAGKSTSSTPAERNARSPITLTPSGMA